MISMHEFDSREDLFDSLATVVTAYLSEGIAQRGRASMAVPGGTTPGPFFQLISQTDLDWSNIFVTLTDERCVPGTSDRSNRKLLQNTLMINNAAAARLCVPELNDETGDAAAALFVDALAGAFPLDLTIVGMGTDMHTASLFPGADNLAAALSPDAPTVLPIEAPGADEPRMTLTAPALNSAARIIVLITGEEKYKVFEEAAKFGPVEDAPIRALLHSKKPVHVYWAP